MARAKALLAHDPLRRWTAADANDTYNIPRWGCGYFGVNDQGNLVVQPRGEANGTGVIDMNELINELVARGIQLPILLRFSDILRARIELLCGAFNGAIKEYGYGGQYRGVYPIKVNQNRTVVEEIISSAGVHYGLEAGGSKPSSSRSRRSIQMKRRSSSATATRTRSISRPRCSPRRWARRSSLSSRSRARSIRSTASASA
jgi:arginine decarboxylase-like protein